MGSPAAKIGTISQGYCSNDDHGSQAGKDITGSPNVFINNIAAARLTDTVQANCGDIGKINTASNTVFVNGLKKARINDTFTGTYSGSLVSNGAPDVNVG
jgi:uncharacterized Zn-binding protein involved in type VI secretion